METDHTSRSQRYQALALAFLPPEDGDAGDMLQAYTRLFLGPGAPIAYPYESVYVEGQLMGATTAKIEDCYAMAGLHVTPANKELPDHIALELAFMAHLILEEEKNPLQSDFWRSQQRNFLHQHLAQWLPRFCQRIIESNIHPDYSKLAKDTKRFVEEDAARLRTDSNATIKTDAPPISTGAVDSFKTVSDGIPRKHVNVKLRVDSSSCTLCTLCADSCGDGALTIAITRTTIQLSIDPACCNGCRACLRSCPEKAISIELDPALIGPPSDLRKALVSAPRVICPKCGRPHVAAPWKEVLALRMGGDETIRKSLEYCPFCKVNMGSQSTASFDLPQETSTRG
jgi:TorA maturation chaperone TorD/ferredoxin